MRMLLAWLFAVMTCVAPDDFVRQVITADGHYRRGDLAVAEALYDAIVSGPESHRVRGAAVGGDDDDAWRRRAAYAAANYNLGSLRHDRSPQRAARAYRAALEAGFSAPHKALLNLAAIEQASGDRQLQPSRLALSLARALSLSLFLPSVVRIRASSLPPGEARTDHRPFDHSTISTRLVSRHAYIHMTRQSPRLRVQYSRVFIVHSNPSSRTVAVWGVGCGRRVLMMN